MRYLQIVHAIPGRTRLRCPDLRGEPAAVERVADAFAATRGVHEVNVRPYTGSMLVTHDADVTVATLVEVARRELACDRVVAQGESPPVDGAAPELSEIAKRVVAAVRGIDRDVLRATEGGFDLGTLATLGFFGAGAIEVVADRELQMPPWFNLAWWGYRTFMTNEQDEIEACCDDDDADAE